MTDDRRRGAMWPDSLPADTTVAGLAETDRFHVSTFGDPGHAVFVVSSLSDTDAQEVARAMVGPVSQALAGAS